MKIQRLLGSLLVLALLLAPGRVASGSALPDEAPAIAQEGAGFHVVAGPDGNIVYADTCDQGDVQDAVEAAGDGDFVVVPAGHCTWTTPVAATPAVEIDGRGVTIQGAGVGQTVITDATGSSWRQTPFWVEGTEGKPFRITGFTFTGQPSAQGVIMVRGTWRNFRIDHCRFENIDGRSIMVDGHTYGVIDHCDFWQLGGQGVWVGDRRGDPPGSTSWDEAMSYGTADAVFVEDSTFIWGSGSDGAIDCTDGGRYVFRHNVVEGVTVGNHGMDSRPRSCLQMEIYDNTFVPSSHSVYLAIQSRGGSAVVFSNTISGDVGVYRVSIGVTNYRSCCYAGAACTPLPNPPHGTCDGTNPLDGNTEPQEVYKGWPCKDQIGRGSQQSSQPFYEWNNTKNGSDVDVTVYNNWTGCTDPQPSDHVQEGRDYFNDTPRPGYTPYVYPHPLTKELVLTGAPGDRTARLNWTVKAVLPVTVTWHVDYYTTALTAPFTATSPLSATRAYTLTGLTNYQLYTVTLNAVLDATPILTDTVCVMPTDKFEHLPLVLR
ncbi:MAG: hypothetical protein JXA14_12230 [Anaerolineae bacterium]|nr:hypothetical protein [Anaerolineae bacterium]